MILGPLPCIVCGKPVVLVREPLELVYESPILGRLQLRDKTGQMPHACA